MAFGLTKESGLSKNLYAEVFVETIIKMGNKKNQCGQVTYDHSQNKTFVCELVKGHKDLDPAKDVQFSRLHQQGSYVWHWEEPEASGVNERVGE
jgi:hypothetical protein